MAIHTKQEQQAALELALGALEDLQTALDAVPYASQSEAMRYERATLANAIDNVRTAMVLAGGQAEAVEQQLAKYRSVSAEGSTAVEDFEHGLEAAAPGTYEAQERLGRAGRAWLESQPWGQA